MNTFDFTFQGPGIPDEAFFRGSAPMTKCEVRAVTLSKMRPRPDAKVLDIGAGTGAMTIELALACPEGHVTAIERNEEALHAIEQNISRFSAKNVRLLSGYAPQDLPKEAQYDCVFVGGSGGQIEAIVSWCQAHMPTGGRLAANFITPENLAGALSALRAGGFTEPEVVQMQVSRGRRAGNVTLMDALNPVYIVVAERRTIERKETSK